MNRIKRISALLLAFVLAVVLMFGVTPYISVGEAFTEINAVPLAQISVAPSAVTTAIGADGYICFDLAAGNVTIGKTDETTGKRTYSGYVFVQGMDEAQPVTGEHATENKYYIYQSNNDIKGQTGYTSTDGITNRTGCRIPQYPRVQNGSEPWTDYVTDNINVKEVSENWDTAAANSGRIATGNRITFASESDYTANVTIDNIWSTFHEGVDVRTAGGIGANLSNTGIACEDTHILLKLKGDNRVGCIHYSAGKDKRNTIEFYDGENADTSGSITVADFSPKKGGRWNNNHWASAIGGADSPPGSADKSDGIVIHSGVIYAGTTPEDNCTAIGGGGNDYGGVTINNGTVTAVAATTGTAIGGGIGWGGYGGDANVTINKGTVYAYNFGVDNSSSDKFEHYVPAVAIGGGSSQDSGGNANTTVNINGGFVYAQSMGGAAIGGGGSAKQYGGSATINISGGTVIAKSTSGTFKGTADPDVVNIPAGVSIGGGTGLSYGGTVEMHISGGTLRTGSIGGGKSTGGGLTGSAQVYISDGDIVGQVIMAAGARDVCIFDMSGGTLHDTNVIEGNTIEGDPHPDIPITYSEDNGGAVWMDAHNGKTTITGGTIENCTAQNGGAIYMTVGTFSLSGTGKIINNTARQDGGAVYVGGGTVKVEGGSISNNTAQNGGGMFVGEGEVIISGGSISYNTAEIDGGGMHVVGDNPEVGATVDVHGGEIHNNTAKRNGGGMHVSNGRVGIFGGTIHDNSAVGDGGGVYVAGDVHMVGGSVKANKATNGGGFCVKDGFVLMYGGSVERNTAVEKGGGMHVSATTKQALVDIFSGSISHNLSKNGGGISVVSDTNHRIDVTVGVNCAHPNLDFDTRTFTAFDYPDPAGCGEAHKEHTHYHANLSNHSACPQVLSNSAEEKGGGFYLQSEQTYLTFYCVVEQGNKANGSAQCWNMDVRGGHVNIGDREYHNEDTPDIIHGNILMQSSIFVEKGQVDVWGEMNNPRFTGDVSVQIEDPVNDHYIDHRLVKGSEVAYKVHYYENFTKDNVTSGLYIARQYPDLEHENAGDEKYNFVVMSSIFSREGYTIIGWNTKPNGKGVSFEVNGTYNLNTLKGQGLTGNNSTDPTLRDEHLLILYAIWEPNVYVLKFDPNVGRGGSYSGTMANQLVTVDLRPQTLTKNAFKRSGYMFMGWSLKSDGSGVIYADEYSIVEDFTKKDGETITLYAQWQVCDHVGFLAYTVGDSANATANVLIQSCSMCNRHTATATLSSVNSTYDGNEHLATVTFSVNWLSDKPVISYTMAADETWDSKDQVDDNWNANPNSKPLHAGHYTATITVEGVEAKSQFAIRAVQWATPAVPVISFSVQKNASGAYDNIITITTPIGENIMYKATYLSTDEVEADVSAYPEWRKETNFVNISLGNYYYFYAKVIADRDHNESLPSRSEAYLATGGNIVYVDNATGIKVVPKYGNDSFQYTVSADVGYHLRGYTDNLTNLTADNTMNIEPADLPDFVKPVPGAEGSDAHIASGGIKISKEKISDGSYKYTVVLDGTKVAYHQITLRFSGAVKNAYITHKVTDGQVFRNFNEKPTTISCDCAFTAQFTLRDYYLDEYNAPTLSFTKVNAEGATVSQVLPVGTTVIMKVDNNYWYYKFSSANTVVVLTDFTAMGGTAKYTFGATGGTTNTDAQTTTYLFIIDFSQTAGAAIGNLNVTLGMTANKASVPDIPTEGSTNVTLSIANKAKFELALPAVEGESAGETATINCNYTASTGAASIWDGRKTALVLTAPDNAPADLTLTAVIGETTSLYTMNAGRKFIIPLDGIDDNSVKITLNSKLFGSTAENLTFTAEWYVSQSGADISPVNGYLAYTRDDVTFSCKKDPVPSVRIDGDVHVRKAGEELEVTVTQTAIPSGGTVTAYLQVKTGGKYVDTGSKQEISGTAPANVKFGMGKMDKGSYRILVVVKDVSGANILEVPYYFVIA